MLVELTIPRQPTINVLLNKMHYDKRILYIMFIMFVCLQMLMDPNQKHCVDLKGKTLIFFHHVIMFYILFGSLVFGYHNIHFVFVIISFIVHKYSGICPITKWHNKLCGIKENTPLFTWLNMVAKTRRQSIHLYYSCLFLVVIYDLRQIYTG